MGFFDSLSDAAGNLGDALENDALVTELESELEPDGPVDRDLVYDTGSWVRFMWSEAMEDADFAHEIRERYPDTEWPALARELFGRLYGTVSKMGETPLGAEWAEPIHESASELSEWDELVGECKGDSDLSLDAAREIQRELETPEDPPKNPCASALEASESGSERSAQEVVERIKASREAADSMASAQGKSALRRKARRAVRAALESTKKRKAVEAMLSCGSEPSSLERKAWATKLHYNRDLAEIALLAGRMETHLQEADSAEVDSDFGRDDLVGLKLGNSVSESVPMERALFSHPVLGLVQAAKMAEGRLLQNRQVGLAEEEHAGGGPLVFAVDESGSMTAGAPSFNVVAKAVALTLARKCADDERTFAFLHWSTSFSLSVYPSGKGMNSTIADELSHFFSGGTDLPGAIREAARVVRQEQPEMPSDDAKRADTVLITDAAHYEHGRTSHAIDELLETGSRLFVVHVDNGPPHPELERRATRYLQVTGHELKDGKEIALDIHSNLKGGKE